MLTLYKTEIRGKTRKIWAESHKDAVDKTVYLEEKESGTTVNEKEPIKTTQIRCG